MSLSSRQICTTTQVPGQPEHHSKTLFQVKKSNKITEAREMSQWGSTHDPFPESLNLIPSNQDQEAGKCLQLWFQIHSHWPREASAHT